MAPEPTRAAIVSGASSGIGLELVRLLASEGHAVTMSARKPDKLQDAVNALQAEGFDVHGVAGNVSDSEAIARVVSEHRERYGRLDVLVNNAGIGIEAPIGELDDKRLDMQLDVNLRSALVFYRETAELLKAAGAEHGALVVNISSLMAKRPGARVAAYSAAKAGLIALNEAMNRELNEHGVKSTAICPGLVDSAMGDGFEDAPSHERIQVSDITELVRFLLHMSPACVIPEITMTRPGLKI